MSPELNKALIRRIVDEVCNQRRLQAAADLFAASVLERAQKDGVLNLICCPDLQVWIECMVAEADMVAVRYSARASIPRLGLGDDDRGKRITWTGMAMARIAGGKVVDYWLEVNMLNIAQQLHAGSRVAVR